MPSCTQFVAAVALGLAGNSAHATIVQVQVHGAVAFNQIQGSHAGIPPGAPVVMGFQVDSDTFVNSPNFPTRGYQVALPSFSMTVGGAAVTMDNPQPFGPVYFVLRNNDPAVDGFVLSRNVDVQLPATVHIPGLTPAHDLDFLVTYPSTELTSLDILDAVGSYDLTGVSVFGWTIGRFGTAGAEYNYQSMTISIVPAPAGAAVLGLLLMGGPRRRR